MNKSGEGLLLLLGDIYPVLTSSLVAKLECSGTAYNYGYYQNFAKRRDIITTPPG